MKIDEQDYIEHYGILRRSGRYPWGSGRSQSTRNKSFLDHIAELKDQGMSDTEICRAYDIPSTQYRAAKTMARAEQKQRQRAEALKLKDKGLSNGAIAERMGLPGESSVRALIAEGATDKADQLMSISNMLKSEADSKRFVDVGSGVENHIGVSKERLNVALAMLKEQGYEVHRVKGPQTTTKFDTDHKVLVPPGVTQKEAWLNRDNIQQLSQVSQDGGRTFGRVDHPPLSIHPKRLEVKYHDEGGAEKDGVIYVRPGVKDVSLGKNRYAQVRVKIGDDHYLKGMAMYKDDLPEGIDLVFHTSADRTPNKLDVLKPLKDDPTLPFGSVVNQITEHTGTPNERVTSAMNLVGSKEGSGGEGSWSKWSRNISAQALSKQNPSVAREQLDRTYKARKAEYDEILALNNPVVKKKLLESFADSTDKSAVHLKAAAFERQNWHVILPVETMHPLQIYAPKYNDGERVALIRYPHGGTFEIPELTVNNRHPEAKKLLGDSRDAVGIHHSVAERLSGADFDGDTVLVIPNNKGRIKTSPALEQLKGFDPRRIYKFPEGVEFKGNTQHLMGDVSNLITDMTLQGASHEKISRAVRHSMVVIDAEKHGLDYKRSYEDFGIRALKEEFQGVDPRTGRVRGASTLISRAKARVDVPERKPRPYKQGGPINKKTGAKEYVPTGRVRRTPTGREIPITTRSRKLAETDDAFTLVSDALPPVERFYAEHSNRLKDLANQARLSMIQQPPIQTSASAKRTYAAEVSSLNAKLSIARRNSPLERQANIIANQAVAARRASNPDLKGDTLNKIKYQELVKARERVGAKKEQIEITQREWDAIQAGAISNSRLNDILDNADLETVRKLATPRPKRLMTKAKAALAMQLLDQGYTRAEVASRLGVSVSTLDLSTSGDDEEED